MTKPSTQPSILVINAGSSSIRFAIFECGPSLRRAVTGKIERIGLPGASLRGTGPDGREVTLHLTRAAQPGSGGTHGAAIASLLGWLEAQPSFEPVVAVGHRIVHGMSHRHPERITTGLLAKLRRFVPFDPEHLPRELELIEAIRERHPKLLQVACFDTAFHRTMPEVARRLPIPRRYARHGVERYGFHGLSYAYQMEELRRLDAVAARGRVILAHLGNGASMAALREERSVDTTMGFTPAAGMMMSTRSGDLDPGLPYYLARTEGMTPSRFQRMVNEESGLLGVSGLSPDMRDLLRWDSTKPHAAEAVALYCYQARKWVGALAAALGGVDTLVFAGGIGENAPSIRARICSGLGFLGIRLSAARNARGVGRVSTDASRVQVRVIRTDEEVMIARSVQRMLGGGTHNMSPTRARGGSSRERANA